MHARHGIETTMFIVILSMTIVVGRFSFVYLLQAILQEVSELILDFVGRVNSD